MQKHTCSQKMQPIMNTPANKHIEKQKRFRSTKKKRKTGHNARFAKPSKDEICSLFPKTNDGMVLF
jgi:hypothetical protein